MNLGALSAEVVLTLAAAELSGVLDRLARVMIRWSVRLSFGWAPQGHNRLLQATRDLANCRTSISRLLFAFWMLLGGGVDWLRRRTGRPGPFGAGGLPRSQLVDAALAVGTGLRDFGDDLRIETAARRREFGRLTSRLHGLLALPPESFPASGAAAVLLTAASTCEVYVEDRDERTALALAEAAFPLCAHLDSRHAAVLALRLAHARAVQALGHPERALGLLHALVADERAAFGAGDPRTLRTLEHYGWAFLDCGRPAEGEARLRAVRTALAAAPGEEEAELHVRCKLGWTAGLLSRHREAAEEYEAVYRDRCRHLGPDHPDALDTRHSQGKLLLRAGRPAEARAILGPLLHDLARVEGARHPNTLETRKHLAFALALSRPADARARRRARRVLRRVLRLQTRRHGPAYPNTRETRRLLDALAGTPGR